MTKLTEVAGFTVALDRAYDPDGHFWISVLSEDRARVGLDALGVDTSGTISQIAFLPVGERLTRGEPFGSLEAAKFVGPLTSPLSGVVSATNDAVVTDPAMVERDPYGGGWLVELLVSDRAQFGELISGGEAIRAWFAAEVEDYRLKGVLAE